MSELESVLQYKFNSEELLHTALTHKSFHFESKDKTKSHNERLEFLGDAVLDLVLGEILLRSFLTDSEGNLSKKRASLVNESILAKVAASIGLSNYMILGKGEALTGGDKKPRLLASTYEALIGAMFLDGGYELTKACVKNHFEPFIAEMNLEYDYVEDFKTRLQENVQSELKLTPIYKLISESGPSHNRTFEVEVHVSDKLAASGVGKSKKSAEQMAAKTALDLLIGALS